MHNDTSDHASIFCAVHVLNSVAFSFSAICKTRSQEGSDVWSGEDISNNNNNDTVKKFLEFREIILLLCFQSF